MEQNTSEIVEDRFSVAYLAAVMRDVLRQWYLIVVVALIAGMGVFVLKDMSYVPQYATSTTYVISTGGTSSSTFQNLNATRDLAGVFTEVLNSSLLQNKVMEQVGITKFDGTITASAVPETNLLTVQVTGSDPRTVFLVSKAIQEHHSIVSGQLLEGVILEVLKNPSVPVAPMNPLNLGHAMKKGVILAAAGMVALLGVISFLSDKVRSRTEADYKLRCRVLGELYHEKKYKTLREKLVRRKNSVLISNHTTSFVYTESINKLANRVGKRMHQGEKVLMVTSFLENEGKTTVAANLALSLAEKGKRVLLIDCDLRKPSCALALNQSAATMGVADILTGKANLKNTITQVGHSNLYLLSSRKGMHMAGDLVSNVAMKSILQATAEQFDYVIMDTPPMSLAPDAEYLAGLADASLLVVRQNRALAADLNDCVGILERSGSHMLGCVLNNVYGSGNFAPAYHYGAYGSYKRYGKSGYGSYGYGPKKSR